MYHRGIDKERPTALLARSIAEILDFLEKTGPESAFDDLVILRDALKPTIDYLLRRRHETKSIQEDSK